MPRDAAELGQGHLWSIASATRLLEGPFHDGIAACIDHAEFAGNVYRENERNPSQSSQLRAVERLGDSTTKIIETWRDSGGMELPVEHPDLSYDLSSQTIRLRDQRMSNISFDPNVKHVSTAVHRLRTVRMAIPEILRKHLPTVEQADAEGLSGVVVRLLAVTHRRHRPSVADNRLMIVSDGSRRLSGWDR